MPKIKIDNVVLRRADDRSMGEISFEHKPFLRVKFQFPDNHNLFSPDGDFQLDVWYDNKQLELSDENCEEIRDALDEEFDDLSMRRLRDVARVIHNFMK